jgi:hypothetical protein
VTAEHEDKLLTTHDLAERWGLHPGTLANQRSAGRGLPFVRLGRSVRYRLSDVLAVEATRHVRSSH